MKVLVLGGAGYIGSHVVKELLRHEFQISIYDNLSTGSRSNIPSQVDFVFGDVQDKDSLTHFMVKESFDAVIHLAALKAAGESMEFPEKYAQANITGSSWNIS